jgi:hypothetical protein
MTEGVRLLAAEQRASIVDVSGIDWIDVDDARAHVHAETWWCGRMDQGTAARHPMELGDDHQDGPGTWWHDPLARTPFDIV